MIHMGIVQNFEIQQGDKFDLVISYRSSTKDVVFEAPDLKKFKLVQPPDTNRQVFTANTTTTYITNIKYVLTSKKVMKAEIGPAKMTYNHDGLELTSNTLSFNINKRTSSHPCFYRGPKQQNFGAGRAYQITFVMEGELKGFLGPEFENLEVVQGPKVSDYTREEGGKIFKGEQMEYLVKSRKKGIYKIGGASVICGGKTYVSTPVEGKVE